MKIWIEYEIEDKGFFAPSVPGVNPLPEISGLSNQGDEQFFHKGFSGYPTKHTWMAELSGIKVLALFDDEPDEGGVEIAEADVLAKLKADYGFPQETAMGHDGLPVVPEISG